MKYQKSEALKQLVEFNKPLSISNVLDSCMEFFKISYSLKSECKILGGPNGPEYKEDCHIQSKTTFCFYSPEDGNEESLSAFMLDHRSSNSGDSCSIDTGSIPLSYSASSQLKQLSEMAKTCKKTEAIVQPSPSISVTTLLNFGRSQRCVPLESGSTNSNVGKHAMPCF
ncbi:uncharacterized protein LOC144355203 [Saccoglossus kowalevskii]